LQLNFVVLNVASAVVTLFLVSGEIVCSDPSFRRELGAPTTAASGRSSAAGVNSRTHGPEDAAMTRDVFGTRSRAADTIGALLLAMALLGAAVVLWFGA
jgi:hypothetical protein